MGCGESVWLALLEKMNMRYVVVMIAAREEYIKNYIQFTHELEACVGNLHHDRAKIS